MTISFLSAIISLVIIVIMLIIYFYNPHRQEYEDYITGAWTADKQFCKESEIDGSSLVIGKASPDGKRTCHLIMDPDITEQIITINYSKSSGGRLSIKKYEITPTIEWTKEEIWPEDCRWEFDMKNGLLRIYHEDNLYGVYFKDNELSSIIVD